MLEACLAEPFGISRRLDLPVYLMDKILPPSHPYHYLVLSGAIYEDDVELYLRDKCATNIKVVEIKWVHIRTVKIGLFFCEATGTYTVAVRGTQGFENLVTDVLAPTLDLLGHIGPFFKLDLIDTIAREVKSTFQEWERERGIKISALTGHSLGGAIASLASQKDCPAITFNAFYLQDWHHAINFTTSQDWVTHFARFVGVDPSRRAESSGETLALLPLFNRGERASITFPHGGHGLVNFYTHVYPLSTFEDLQAAAYRIVPKTPSSGPVLATLTLFSSIVFSTGLTDTGRAALELHYSTGLDVSHLTITLIIVKICTDVARGNIIGLPLEAAEVILEFCSKLLSACPQIQHIVQCSVRFIFRMARTLLAPVVCPVTFVWRCASSLFELISASLRFIWRLFTNPRLGVRVTEAIKLRQQILSCEDQIRKCRVSRDDARAAILQQKVQEFRTELNLSMGAMAAEDLGPTPDTYVPPVGPWIAFWLQWGDSHDVQYGKILRHQLRWDDLLQRNRIPELYRATEFKFIDGNYVLHPFGLSLDYIPDFFHLNLTNILRDIASRFETIHVVQHEPQKWPYLRLRRLFAAFIAVATKNEEGYYTEENKVEHIRQFKKCIDALRNMHALSLFAYLGGNKVALYERFDYFLKNSFDSFLSVLYLPKDFVSFRIGPLHEDLSEEARLVVSNATEALKDSYPELIRTQASFTTSMYALCTRLLGLKQR